MKNVVAASTHSGPESFASPDDFSHPGNSAHRPLIVIGVTDPQTCLILRGRVRALRRAGFRVILISSPGEHLDRFIKQEGIAAIPIRMRRGIAPESDLVALIRLTILLRRLAPDMTEFSTPKAGLLGSVAAFLAEVPVRVYLLRGLRLETAQGLLRRILLAGERLAALCSHAVLLNSRSLLAEAQRLAIAPTGKLILLGDGSSSGVDTERFAPAVDSAAREARSELRRQAGIPEQAPVIGYVGRLTRDKGIPELVEAFDGVLGEQPEARLLLVGWFDSSEDALSAELRQRIVRHPGIVCTGFVQDAAPWYPAMDVMVLPTRREGFPNAALEAAASGIPVITTLATGARDAVVPDQTGLLIPPGSPDAIRDATLALLRDDVRRLAMGAAARQWAVEHYDEKRVLGLMTGFYADLLQARTSRRRQSHRVGVVSS